ncbi:hypothetical protein BGW41_004319 [Actinomortierella wolfii]|nr:hypothetical protein BGW41_004319 [Actinomortierella wolfii]
MVPVLEVSAAMDDASQTLFTVLVVAPVTETMESAAVGDDEASWTWPYEEGCHESIVVSVLVPSWEEGAEEKDDDDVEETGVQNQRGHSAESHQSEAIDLA